MAIWCGQCGSFKLKPLSFNKLKCQNCKYEFNVMWTERAYREFFAINPINNKNEKTK
jgi:hypothetical protein